MSAGAGHGAGSGAGEPTTHESSAPARALAKLDAPAGALGRRRPDTWAGVQGDALAMTGQAPEQVRDAGERGSDGR